MLWSSVSMLGALPAHQSVIYAIWVIGSTAEGSQLRPPSFSTTAAPSTTERSRHTYGLQTPTVGIRKRSLQKILFQRCDCQNWRQGRETSEGPWPGPSDEVPGFLTAAAGGGGSYPTYVTVPGRQLSQGTGPSWSLVGFVVCYMLWGGMHC